LFNAYFFQDFSNPEINVRVQQEEQQQQSGVSRPLTFPL
jgi:hypothetical protein